MVAQVVEVGGLDQISGGAFAVVSGGGTAGHVLPALAVADALVTRGIARERVVYAGCQRGIETEIVPPTGHPYLFFDVVGIQRRLTASNLGFVPKMIKARRAAISLLRELRPKVVVSVGGYASMPAVFAARRLGIPVVTVSFDHRPGLASKLTARFSAASAVAFPDSPLPRATQTGAPVRAEILAVDRDVHRNAARVALGIDPDRFMVAVIGGSQGSGILNDAVWGLVERDRGDSGLAIRHAVGARFVERAPAPVDGEDVVQYQPIGFETNMADVYAAADLLVGRGGASTVHEVAVTGTPAILVPWAGAAEDHQTGNVRWLSDREAAILLPEEEIGQLGAIIDRLRADDAELASLAVAAREMGEQQRSGALGDLLVEVAETADGDR